MIKHKKVYCNFFGYDYGDVIPCEVCKHDYIKNQTGMINEAVDIHHIVGRKMGGSKCCNINEIYNLIAICRQHHIEAEANKQFNKQIKIIHLKNIIKKLES